MTSCGGDGGARGDGAGGGDGGGCGDSRTRWGPRSCELLRGDEPQLLPLHEVRQIAGEELRKGDKKRPNTKKNNIFHFNFSNNIGTYDNVHGERLLPDLPTGEPEL